MCCRPEAGYPTDDYLKAGKWGGYECDLPKKTLQSMLDHVKDIVKPDFFFWTGDNSPHNTWANTAEEVTNYTLEITKMVKDTFKDSEIKVYPCLGNHDTWPVNVEDFTTAGDNNIINSVGEGWQEWLGEEATA
jgi:sphingomyelin phosphodiesterase